MRIDKVDKLKKAMVESLAKCLGVVTDACREVGISRQTHYNWYKDDPEYKQAVDDVDDIAIDFAESALYEKIKSKDTIATIFYLKTRGRRRGYNEHSEIDLKGIPPPLNINVDSQATAKVLELLRNVGKSD